MWVGRKLRKLAVWFLQDVQEIELPLSSLTTTDIAAYLGRIAIYVSVVVTGRDLYHEHLNDKLRTSCVVA